ncbi:MAG: corrinoid protein [Candidatus Marinimicrobia bacterium]|nr:corrinoid protein [Candidatus Neomarinimicrobiota bacterium]MBL7113427.1 corrinoid protein [Bacteroidales bacterium]
MEDLLNQLTSMVEVGKINKMMPHPPELMGQDGVSELTLKALDNGVDPQSILNNGLMPGMKKIGEKFARGEAYIPNMLIAAKAMTAAMDHLRPYFSLSEIKPKGILIIGTVKGDLHDIGKNLVKMTMKGDGWDVIDLGTDVGNTEFINAAKEHPEAIVGMSALLTTTMLNMDSVAKELRQNNPNTKIYVGGAPVSQSFCESIGADGYFRDPYSFANSFK